MPKMDKAVEGIHTSDKAEGVPVEKKEKPKRAAPKSPPPSARNKLSYTELSPVIREALVAVHRDRGIDPDWRNLNAAMRDCQVRIQRGWKQFVEEATRG